MHIRDAIPADWPQIVAIYNSTIASRMVTADTEPVSEASKHAWLQAHQPGKRPLWVVEQDGNVMGWVSFKNFYGRPAYQATAEISIYLATHSRGIGLGTQLLNYCIEQCPALGIKQLLAFIFSHNQPSIALFTRAGFEQWGFLPHVAEIDEKPISLSIYGLKI